MGLLRREKKDSKVDEGIIENWEKQLEICPKCNKKLLTFAWYSTEPVWIIKKIPRPKTATILHYMCMNCGFIEQYVDIADLRYFNKKLRELKFLKK